MKKYEYYDEIVTDIIYYIQDNVNVDDFESIEELEEHLHDLLWTEDSVTGNGSGSYTFNTWEAEENLCHNMDLLQEALECFGCDIKCLEKGAEWCDVTIRCYLLGSALHSALSPYEFYYDDKEESEEE